MPFPAFSVRAEIVSETLQILRLALHGHEAVTFEGRHFSLRSASFEPRPVQRRLRLWVGAAEEHRMIPLAAQLADGWNLVTSSPAEFLRKKWRLEDACRLAGRDPDTLSKSVAAVTLGPIDRADALKGTYAAWRGLSEREATDQFIIGSDDEVCERLLAFAAADVELFVFILRLPAEPEHLAWLAETAARVRLSKFAHTAIKPIGH
jgi:alkanesulfonate monooxygenase SsuD/methylene tetrahydromethanopterin reductase-like flavin-dependent oxidoreductase (luciferase family)